MFIFQVGDLVQANAVLAAAGAVHVDGAAQARLVEVLPALQQEHEFLDEATGSCRVGAVEVGMWTEKFAAALDDDLAVPIALAEVHAARAEGNRALDGGDHEGAMAAATSIRAMMGILGCDPLDERWESRDETSAALNAVDALVQWALKSRTEARENRDWAAADAIRDQLKLAGIEVTDTADGPQWALTDGA